MLQCIVPFTVHELSQVQLQKYEHTLVDLLHNLITHVIIYFTKYQKKNIIIENSTRQWSGMTGECTHWSKIRMETLGRTMPLYLQVEFPIYFLILRWTLTCPVKESWRVILWHCCYGIPGAILLMASSLHWLHDSIFRAGNDAQKDLLFISCLILKLTSVISSN